MFYPNGHPNHISYVVAPQLGFFYREHSLDDHDKRFLEELPDK